MIHEAAMPKLIALAIAGKPDEAKAHVGHMVRRGADLAPLREQVRKACAPEYVYTIMGALPWLAEATFDPREPRKRELSAQDAIAMLDKAGAAGLRKCEFSGAEFRAIEEQIATFDEPTGGRPREMVRLRAHDPRFNVFAKQ